MKKGYNQKEAVTCAVNECIKKGILKDILEKHRAEVVDMFLTTFDKKMYEEALREEGRQELEEDNRLLKEELTTLTQQNSEQAQQLDALAQQNNEKDARIAELEALLEKKNEV